MAAGDDWTAPGTATQVIKGASRLIRSRRVLTRTRSWYVALSVVLIVAFSACASFVGADESIVVGKETYRTPFTQYPPLVAETLMIRPVDSSTEQGPDDMFAQVDWLLFLGMAHRRTLEQKEELTEADYQEIARSTNALRQGIALIKQIRERYPFERLNTALRLAELFVNTGETYNLSPHNDEYKLAMDYFVQGEDIYRQTLESEDSFFWGDGSDEEASREEVELRWAHCCHRIGVALLAMAQEIDHSSDLNASLLADPERVQEIMASSIEKIHANALMAENHLRKAVEIFSKISKEGSKNTEHNGYALEQVDIERHLATSLSNLGTAVGMTGDLATGIEYSEQALELYQKLYPRLPDGDIITSDAMMDISDMLYTLAEQYLQLGNYDKAKQHYSKAMEWALENNIAPPEDLGEFEHGISELDDAIDAHEAQLEAYNVLNNDAMEIEVSDYGEDEVEDHIYHGKDDLYEGDIHMSLGSLYLAKGDLVSAGSHLSQSIKLYELSGEEEDRNLADAKFNMAVLRYRTGEYVLSRESYDSALAIYRDVVGSGIDPRMAGMSEVPRVSPRSSVDVDNKAEEQTQSETQTQSEAKKQNEKEGSIHEDWVDLDDVIDTRMNATIKDEL
jgi:tetratricopeptide (TPR) repeat protein